MFDNVISSSVLTVMVVVLVVLGALILERLCYYFGRAWGSGFFRSKREYIDKLVEQGKDAEDDDTEAAP